MFWTYQNLSQLPLVNYFHNAHQPCQNQITTLQSPKFQCDTTRSECSLSAPSALKKETAENDSRMLKHWTPYAFVAWSGKAQELYRHSSIRSRLVSLVKLSTRNAAKCNRKGAPLRQRRLSLSVGFCHGHSLLKAIAKRFVLLKNDSIPTASQSLRLLEFTSCSSNSKRSVT